MGTDNLFHKRKAQKANAHRREENQREPYARVLIVCEGGKTEPNYLAELCDSFKLSTANIKIVGDACGSSPRDVVTYAIKAYKGLGKSLGQEKTQYDQVFCVFDKDRHLTYNEALAKLREVKLRKGSSVRAITSVPCFEVWILLHFGYTTKSFTSSGASGSICNSVIRQLKRSLPGYAKGMTNLFPTLLERLPAAIKHAKQLEAHGISSDTDNPSTQMHHLVEYLRDLKNRD